MTYRKTADYLESFINYEDIPPEDYRGAFKLKSISGLLSSLRNPHKDLKIIHVAGTKGKGSTALLMASVLKEAGFHVGLYTSPHLTSCCERIRVDGCPIREKSLSKITGEIRPHVERLRKENITFFELYTAIALLYFKRMEVDLAVIETGLGGRLDATNVVDSLVSVITPVSFEHTRILGSTLRRIAREKAAIIKKNSVCVSAPQEKDVLDVIEKACNRNKASLFVVGRDIFLAEGYFDKKVQHFSVRTPSKEYAPLELKLRGEHQLVNAATAIGALDALQRYNISIPQAAVRKGMSKAEWPGRMEVIRRNPLVVVDGAQNTASARALMRAVKRHFRFGRLILILGISRDKDIKGICGIFSEEADLIILTRAENPRAAEPMILRKYIRNKTTEVFTDSAKALDFACSNSTKGDLILATGSLFLVGEIIKKSRERGRRKKRKRTI